MEIFLPRVETECSSCLTSVVRADNVSTRTCKCTSNDKISRELVTHDSHWPPTDITRQIGAMYGGKAMRLDNG
ncbi:hypothetical protein TNCV_2314921 [Trichonephila clavipes]|nr:hypothetical protein TNCV_2314921 [Trichonephila clavipes]